MENIEKALGELDTTLQAKAKEIAAAEVAGVKTEVSEIKTAVESIKVKTDAIDRHMNEQKTFAQKNEAKKSFGESLAEQIEKNFDSIRQVSKSRNASMELKAVADMTAANNLTGSVIQTYSPNSPAMIPSPKVNFRDLIMTVPSATGSYVVYREGAGEGSISTQSTHGAAKTQRDYDLTATTFTAQYLAGFTRIAKQMLQDLSFLQSKLPQMLIRDFLKAENAKFYADLIAAATASATTKTVDVEQLVDEVATLEASDFDVNGIIVNPRDWANICMTKPSDYSLPGIVTFQNGQLAINGIPVHKASWVAVDKYLVGDMSYLSRVVVDDLKVEFFEQDSDNVTKNLITVRVEAREVLAIDRADGFIYGDFGNVA